MDRKLFIRNTLLGLATCLFPEILRPMSSDVIEETVPVAVNTWVVAINNKDGSVTYKQGELRWINFPKKQIEFLENGAVRLNIPAKK